MGMGRVPARRSTSGFHFEDGFGRVDLAAVDLERLERGEHRIGLPARHRTGGSFGIVWFFMSSQLGGWKVQPGPAIFRPFSKR